MTTLVREIPAGSHINGRPVLEDGARHLARYDAARQLWVTYCGEDVPPDHHCPPLGRRPDGSSGPAPNCQTCASNYRQTWGLNRG